MLILEKASLNSTERVKKDSESSLRDRLLKELGPDFGDLPKREVTVMTRLSREIVDVLDSLVRLNFFKSRSEAAAVIIEQKVLSNMELFKSISEQAKKIEKVQDELESLALKALKESK
jgi:hypothetical protein